MKKYRVLAIFVLGVALLSLFLLTACQTEVKSASAEVIVANQPPLIVAADLSAARWQAMGESYAKRGLLTHDNFNYQQAAELSSARWQAMGESYERQGLLTRDSFDYEQAADLSAARWQAMGESFSGSGVENAMAPVD